MPITPPTLADLTAASIEGNGVFDVLMKANKAHLEEQFTKGRIKGTEYATVYLGSLEQVLQSAVQFLLAKDKIGLEAQLLEKQIELAEKAIEKSVVELAIAEAQLEIAQQQALKIPAEIALLEAQTAQSTQQTENLVSQKAQIEGQTLLIEQQRLNAVTENTVLVAQECKLRAEYDVLMETKLKTAQETQLLTWKVTTEKAQTSDVGVAENSVIGKQKILYQRQADGFLRDGEQKAAKIMVDSWNVRRTTDEATVADGTNKLSDASVGRAVEKLLTGVGA